VLCHDPKPTEQFNKNKSKRDGLQPHCRECGKTTSKEYYQKNKEKHKKVTRLRKETTILVIKKFVYDYAANKGCIDCGERNVACLDFDHVRGNKRDNVAIMVHDGCSMTSVVSEIEKCEIRCANCHRKKTAKEQNWYSWYNEPITQSAE
jgi:hypothetical protein